MAEFNNLLDQLSVLQRRDLSATEKLVACVLLSFRNSESGRCNPSIFSENAEKETVCTRASLTRKCVINSISNLEKKNILKTTKEIGKPSSYQFVLTRVINTPVNDGNPCTKYTSPVYYEHPTRVPSTPHPCTSYTHNKELTNKEQINNKEEKESKEKDDSFSLTPVEDKPQRKKTLEKPFEVSPQTWSDFNAVRKAKKAPLTETALKRIRQEAKKAGISLEAALQVCCERGWQGFKADWYSKTNSPVRAFKQQAQNIEPTPEDFSDSQISLFAYRISREKSYTVLTPRDGESYEQLQRRIECQLRHPDNFKKFIPVLRELHLIH